MSGQDLYPQVAALHAHNLDQGFLSTMGIDFLALMYRAIDEAPDSVLMVESRGDEVIGFVSGGIGMAAIYRNMLRHPFRLARAMAPSLLRPRQVLRILDILRYSGTATPSTPLPSAELFSIAVSPAWRGRGVAECLYLGLIANFNKRGISEFKITVGEGLRPAQRFYLRMGAVSVAEIQVHNGERSEVYLHRICSPQDQAFQPRDDFGNRTS